MKMHHYPIPLMINAAKYTTRLKRLCHESLSCSKKNQSSKYLSSQLKHKKPKVIKEMECLKQTQGRVYKFYLITKQTN